MRAVEKLLATKRLLTHLSRDFAPVALFQTFSIEALVATDLIYDDLVHQEYSNIKMFTIDTGRLPDESHRLIDQIRERYGDVLKVYYPDASELELIDARYGFRRDYHEHSNEMRFLEPLKRALSKYSAWITGSDAVFNTVNNTMDSTSWISWDAIHQIPRFNPLSRWTKEEVLSYAKHRNLPVQDYLQNTQRQSHHTTESGLRWRQTDASAAWDMKKSIA
ncbi:MAG: phosphoadenosine phosphosulfate reductase family protein [Gammaproteobacteria bacterium]|nr:phosphoadenosine phosphosulfate reductase family protein [Gammaproteobacteria bacterium]